MLGGTITNFRIWVEEVSMIRFRLGAKASPAGASVIGLRSISSKLRVSSLDAISFRHCTTNQPTVVFATEPPDDPLVCGIIVRHL